MKGGPATSELVDLVRAFAAAPDEGSLLAAAVPALRTALGLSGLTVELRDEAGRFVTAATGGAEGDRVAKIVSEGEILGRVRVAGGAEDAERQAARMLAAGLGRVRREEDLAEEVRASRAELQLSRRAEESKDRFLASVSHEFRTPLTSIRSFVEILLSSPDEEPETREEFLSIIHEESIRLSRLVNSLLDLGKMRAGHHEWSFEDHALDEAVLRAVRSVSTVAAEKEIMIRVSGGEDLPPLRFDLDRIIQVLVNLLANAVRYSPAGETVEVLVAGTPDGARVTVRDRGPGIPPRYRQRVFDRFWQMEGGRQVGTGLGLSISLEIVTAHGGRIWVDEAPEGGCDVVFEIAVPDAEPAPTELKAIAD
jgi:signal transduction histidine kinase